MIQTFFTPQNIFSQLCDHVVCNLKQHIKYAVKCDMGTQFMRGVHGCATPRVFVTIQILRIYGRRTTRKNDRFEIRVKYTCEWHQEIKNIDALLCNRVAVTQLGRGDTPQWCHLAELRSGIVTKAPQNKEVGDHWGWDLVHLALWVTCRHFGF